MKVSSSNPNAGSDREDTGAAADLRSRTNEARARAEERLVAAVRAPEKPRASSPLGNLERVLDRARSQLSQAVNVALSDGLEALGDRLNSPRRSGSMLGQVGVAAQAHGFRLREVIERDRALVASSPAPSTQPEPVSAAEPEPIIEPPEMKLDAPFVASAAALAPLAPVACNEPIRTRTMAKLLAMQGHRERALSIYDYLLAKSSDESLRAEAEALRASE